MSKTRPRPPNKPTIRPQYAVGEKYQERDIVPAEILSMLSQIEAHIESRRRVHSIKRRLNYAEGGKPGISVKRGQKPMVMPKAMKARMGKAAPRFLLDAKVVMQRHNRHIKCKALNVSQSGMFVETSLETFRPQEKVFVYVRPKGGKRSYRFVAEIVRYNNDSRYPSGYGLKFVTS